MGQAFIEDISNFKVKDAIQFPKEKATLFIGSSSFTLWKDMATWFPDREVINRGFGGSSLTDLIRYQNEIIYPYKPSIIVIYCGENDIANDEKVDGKVVFDRFTTLYKNIRSHFASIPIAYIAMKPSPARWHLRDKYLEGNQLIAEFLNAEANNYFIDVWPFMLNENETPNKNLFIEDMLHMNRSGYEIWAEQINATFAAIKNKN